MVICAKHGLNKGAKALESEIVQQKGLEKLSGAIEETVALPFLVAH